MTTIEKMDLSHFNRKEYENTLKLLNKHNQKTICIEANCPNRYTCFSKKTATFLILGPKCTRNCKYCDVKQGKSKINEKEINNIIKIIKELNLKFVVITSVTRDDLEDGGAEYFIKLKQELDKINVKAEFLIPDFKGNKKVIKKIIDSNVEVINHNIEVTENLFKELRPEGNYKKSLELLKYIKKINPNQKTKSGFMLGFGESLENIKNTLKDLKEAKVDYITIGQYLQPSKKHFPIIKEYSKEEFEEIKQIANEIGFKKVYCGRFARSSYNAKEMANS